MKHNFFNISRNNNVAFFSEGEKYYNEYLNLIKNSKKSIHLQTYIFMMDSFGKLVYNELINAAKRGVLIYLLVDSVGSRLLEKKYEIAFIKAGINFSRFNQMKIIWPYRWGRRLHHKVLIIDEEVSFVGGINVMGNLNEQLAFPKLDFALLLKGPVIARLTLYCQIIYNKSSRQKILFPEIIEPPPKENGVVLKILVNDWVYRRWQITKQYAHLAKKAKNEITIINSYFFPRRSFIRQLINAAKRGVRVRLILPKISDWPNYILASEFLYKYLLQNGIEIYLWKNSIHHGKIATIDNRWSTIGSFNLNYTSYQQNLEMNINVYSEDFTNFLKNEIEENIIINCEKLEYKNFLRSSNLKTIFSRRFFYTVLSLIAFFSIGLIYQEESKNNKTKSKLIMIGSFVFFILGVIGTILPHFPAIPFFIISFILIINKTIRNLKKENL